MSHVNLNPSLLFFRAHYVLKQILICPHILSCHTFIMYNRYETKKLWEHHFGLCCTSVLDIKICRVQLVAESYAMYFSHMFSKMVACHALHCEVAKNIANCFHIALQVCKCIYGVSQSISPQLLFLRSVFVKHFNNLHTGKERLFFS